jgi:hypothetical protein
MYHASEIKTRFLYKAYAFQLLTILTVPKSTFMLKRKI